ncbi:MAG: VCBS repeat-containing protein [Sandaracinaceae bacterium]|nr:VCBS repeat-containing protein [Sandaracinaceae bacterium]
MAKRVLGLLSLVAALGLFQGPAAQAQDEGGGLSPSRLKLPSGPGSLEGVGEDASINFNMGVVSYGVPFSVPGGYNGFAPSLRLSYASTGGQSSVGLGWSLGGVDSIERMTSRGVPDYDAADLFAHEGTELVRLPGSSTYRARFEGGFVRYTWLGADGAMGNGREGYWRAEFPDGRVGYYGATAAGVLVPESRMAGSRGTYSYGLVEMVDTYDHRIRYDYELDGGRPYVVHIGWVFRGGSDPRYEVELEYEAREDVLSDGKPGVEVLLNRRLRHVRVLVEGTQLRRYQLSYEPYTLTGGLTRLARVTTYGTGDVDPYPIFFRFAYTRGFDPGCASGAPGCERAYVRSIGSVGVDFRTGDADLLDINGDALPDVVDTTGGVHQLFVQTVSATGETSLSPVRTSATAGSGAMALSSPEVQMVDLNGDGFVDMVDGLNDRVLFGRGTGDWDAQALMDTGLPSFTSDANQRFLDVDYDRAIDVVHLESGGAWFHRNDNGVYQAATPIAGVSRSFSTDGLRLVDMNGDGMVDVVQAVQGAVFYWMNLGHGDFASAAREMFGLPGTLTPAEMEFTDLNGDNLTDVVVVQGTEIRFALNCDGTEFEPMETLSSADLNGSLPERTSEVSIRFADMNGSGSNDVVYINASGMVTYVELFPEHPNLLNRIDNGIGKVIEMTYGTTVAHMGRDGGPDAWEHRLPHAMLVLEQLTTYDTLSQVRQIQRMHYRDGYYDGEESQFRGFGEVEVFAEGDDSMEDGRSVHHFDLGVTDRYRHGLVTDKQVESDGRVLSTEAYVYADCPLAQIATAGVTYPIRWLCPERKTTVIQEGAAASEWVTLEETYAHDGYGNQTEKHQLGVTAVGGGACTACNGRSPDVQGEPCDASCRGDEMHEIQRFIAPGSATSGRWILRAVYQKQMYGVEGSAEVTDERTYYDGPDFVGLPWQTLTRGTPRRTEARRDAGGSYFIQTARLAHDAHGNVTVARDPNGHDVRMEYDADGVLPTAELRLFDDPAVRSDFYALRMEVAYEPLLEQITSSTAWMRVVGTTNMSERRETAYGYDEYGRVTGIAQPGDTLATPTTEYAYDLVEPVSRIITRTRSVSGSPTPDLEAVNCVDGMGRTVQNRTAVGDGTYQATGYVTFNIQGEPSRVYQPYLGTSAACDRSAPTGVRVLRSQFDATGRVLHVTQPDESVYGTATTLRTDYQPLRTIAYDGEDLDPSSPHANTPTTTVADGLGRTLRLERLLAAEGPPVVIGFRYDALGRIRSLLDDHGNEQWQVYDLAGRIAEVTHPDSGITRFTYDDANNPLTRTDARGVTTRSSFDEANRQTAFWDERDPMRTVVETRYDRDVACTECVYSEGMAASVSYPLLDGERGADRMVRDARSRLVTTHSLREGVRYTVSDTFDNANRITATTYPGGYSLARTHDGLSRERSVTGIVTSVAFNPQNLPARVNFANGTSTVRTYDARLRLDTLETNGPSGTLQDYSYRFNRADHLVTLNDARPAEATESTSAGRFEYDALYRLTAAHLDEGRLTAESLSYAYDTIDNLVEKRSDRGRESLMHLGELGYGQDGTGAGPHAVSSISSQAAGGAQTYTYDEAGNMLTREGQRNTWDFMGRLSAVDNDDSGEPVARFAYGATRDRVLKEDDGQRTHYLRPDLEVRDGIVTVYVSLNGERVAKVESALFAPTTHSDGAPAGGDGRVTAADAWVVRANEAGVSGVPGVDSQRSVDDTLRAAARTLLIAQEPLVEYWHGDHLGSVVLSTDEAGDVLQRMEHYPYGHPRAQSAHLPDRSYTGQERDGSTGLSYHSARYLDTRLGRWTAADPLFEIVTTQQSHLFILGGANRYVPMNSSPLSMVDESGNWSKWVHRQITRRALRGVSSLSRQDIGAVIAGNLDVDRDQRPDHQHKHAMRDRGRTREESISLANEFVNRELLAAIEAGLAGDREQAMRHLGAAMHTVQDSQSPEHGFDVPWPPSDGSNVVDHAGGESFLHAHIGDGWVTFGRGQTDRARRAVDASLQLFEIYERSVSGGEGLPSKVEVFDRRTGELIL